MLSPMSATPVLLSALVASLLVLPPAMASDPVPAPPKVAQPAVTSTNLPKTNADWRKILSPEQYHVLREAGTERPFGKIYKEFQAQGVGSYVCAGCGALLFTSKEKFDSHCGWPSFYDPANATNVVTHEDDSLGMKRVEVRCAKCDGHLGHVFKGEGFPTPTDLRYCINGVSLKFVPGTNAPAAKP